MFFNLFNYASCRASAGISPTYKITSGNCFCFIFLFWEIVGGAVRGRFEFLDQNAVLIIGPPGGTDLSTNEASPTVW